MAQAKSVQDPGNLSGRKVFDQDGSSLGAIEDVYGIGDDGAPMWITLSVSQGMGGGRRVFVPLARVKEENDELRVPYDTAHLIESPQFDIDDEVSEEQERALRDYYAIDLGDAEQRDAENPSYAAQVPEDDGPAVKVTDS